MFLEPRKTENKVDIAKREGVCNDSFRGQSVQLYIDGDNSIDLNLVMICNNNGASRYLRDFKSLFLNQGIADVYGCCAGIDNSL